MLERILVPLDGSETAEIVFPYAAEIASKFGSRIILTRVSEPGTTISECRSYLENTMEKVKTRSGLLPKDQPEVNVKVLMGSPAYEIINCARDMECGFIVMAGRCASSQAQWPLGNVAEKVLRASDCPVLLIRKPVDETLLKKQRVINRIMVPLDGSRLSEAVLPLAKEFSRTLGAEIVLFRAVEPYIIRPGLSLVRGMATQYENTVISRTETPFLLDYLNGIKEILDKNGVESSVVVGEGSPAVEIIDYAGSHNIDLVMMSTHGLSGIGRWIFGSVTDKVLHSGEMPVLVIRPKENIFLS